MFWACRHAPLLPLLRGGSRGSAPSGCSGVRFAPCFAPAFGRPHRAAPTRPLPSLTLRHVRIKIFFNFHTKSLETTSQSSNFAPQIPKSVCPVHTLWHQTPQPKPNKTPKSPADAPKYVTDSEPCPIIFSPKPLLRGQHTMRIYTTLCRL